MRRTALALFSTAVLLAAVAGLSPAAAMTAGAAPAGLRSASAGTDAVVKASCYRYGWRGWATYSSCEKHERTKPRQKSR